MKLAGVFRFIRNCPMRGCHRRMRSSDFAGAEAWRGDVCVDLWGGAVRRSAQDGAPGGCSGLQRLKRQRCCMEV